MSASPHPQPGHTGARPEDRNGWRVTAPEVQTVQAGRDPPGRHEETGADVTKWPGGRQYESLGVTKGPVDHCARGSTAP